MNKQIKKWMKYVESYNKNSLRKQSLMGSTHVVIDLILEARREVADKIKKRITQMEKDGHVLPRRNIHYCIDLIEKEPTTPNTDSENKE